MCEDTSRGPEQNVINPEPFDQVWKFLDTRALEKYAYLARALEDYADLSGALEDYADLSVALEEYADLSGALEEYGDLSEARRVCRSNWSSCRVCITMGLYMYK
jgi:hypothetical protein